MSEYNMPEGAHDSQHETGSIEDPPEMTIAEQRRAEIESCPEFVRVYIMGLEAAAKELEELRRTDDRPGIVACMRLNAKLTARNTQARVDLANLMAEFDAVIEGREGEGKYEPDSEDAAVVEDIRRRYYMGEPNSGEEPIRCGTFSETAKPDRNLQYVIAKVIERRAQQDAKHGGPAHDDTHTQVEWCRFIAAYNWHAYHESPMHDEKEMPAEYFQDTMFDVAALAVAAIESSRRKRNA